ncbi:MAG: hypothetical protein GX557_14305 [Chloroflexi bacterium]|nr:hypothetical protein [Chloroflexota bacterium]
MGTFRRGLSLAAAALALVAVTYGCYAWLTSLLPSVFGHREALRVATPLERPAPVAEGVRVVVVQIGGLSDALAEQMPTLQALREHGAHGALRGADYGGATDELWRTGAGAQLSGAVLVTEEAQPAVADSLIAAVQRAGLLALELPADGSNDGERMAAALSALAAQPPHLLWLSLIDLEAAVRAASPAADETVSAALTLDARLRALAEAIDLADTCLVVVVGEAPGAALSNRQDPVASVCLAGAGIVPGPFETADGRALAPTLAALLGIAPPALCEGDALLGTLALEAPARAQWSLAQAEQRAHLARAWLAALGGDLSATIESDLAAGAACLEAGNLPCAEQLARFSLNAARTAMNDASATRLATERLHRAPLALLAVMLPALLWLLRADRLRWHLFACALLVPLVAVTLELRGPEAANPTALLPLSAFLRRTATRTALALAPSIVLALLGCALSARRSAQPSVLELGIALCVYGMQVLYLLLLPAIAGFAAYGLSVRWYLPAPDLLYAHIASLLYALLAGGVLCVLPWPALLLAVPAVRRGRDKPLKRLNLLEESYAHRRDRK